MKKNNKTRLSAKLLIIVFTILFVFVSGRFIYIQATGEVQDVSLSEWAENNRKAFSILDSKRGEIFDANGNLLAFNRPVYRVYAILSEEYSKLSTEPLHVDDVEKTARQLAPFLEMDVNDIEKIINDGIAGEKFQVEFGINGNKLSEKVKNDITNLEIPGINFIEESIRYYPNNNFASHVIGIANVSDETGDMTGVTGVELMNDSHLTGEDGYINYQRDRYNRKLLNKEEFIKEKQDGKDVYLTIDQKIQSLLEDVLSQVDEQYEPERITAVVMNPKTGEILAMGNRPSFNLNNPDDVQNWYNDVISTPVEPGSTAKIFTWAAAIDSGVYNGNETYLSGRYKIHDQVEPVNDHNRGEGWGNISFDEGFRRSSNVAASKLVWEKMDTDLFLDYLHKFKLHEKTGIDLPNEVSGQITFNYPSDKLRTAFGQGSTMTPIQQMQAASAIVNGGEMVQPYVVSKVIDKNNNEIVEANERTVVGTPISEQTAEKMKDLLADVVYGDNGTGRRFQLDDYTVMGKTGTAQIPNPEGGGYLTGSNNNIYSFIGMSPKDDPELMMHVSVKQPQLDEFEVGSVPVSFIFKNVMENGLHYLNIEPDQENKANDVVITTFPNVIDMALDDAKQLLNSYEDVSYVGDGDKVIATNYQPADAVYENQKVIVITNKPTIPQLKGWSHRDVLKLESLLNLSIETEGEGFVTEQSLKVGHPIEEGLELSVKFSPTEKAK